MDFIDQRLPALIKETANAIGKCSDTVAHIVELVVKGYDEAHRRRNRRIIVRLRHGIEGIYGGSSIPTVNLLAEYVDFIKSGHPPLFEKIEKCPKYEIALPNWRVEPEERTKWEEGYQESRAQHEEVINEFEDNVLEVYLRWQAVVRQCELALRASAGVLDILSSIDDEKFVFSSTYQKISRAFNERAGILRRFSDPYYRRDGIAPNIDHLHLRWMHGYLMQELPLSRNEISRLQKVVDDYRILIGNIAGASEQLSAFGNEVPTNSTPKRHRHTSTRSGSLPKEGGE